MSPKAERPRVAEAQQRLTMTSSGEERLRGGQTHVWPSCEQCKQPQKPQEEDPLHTGPAWVRNKTRVLAVAAAPLARAQAGETKAPKWVRK